MKVILLMVSVFLCFYCQSRGQDTPVIRVKSGEDVMTAIPVEQRYRFGHFTKGRVTFYNGSSSVAHLNYNLLLGEIQFISPAGDTLSLDQEETVKQIQIGEHFFYYDTQFGFLEAMADYPRVTLAVKEVYRNVSQEKMGAYGQSSGVSSIESFNTYSDNGRLYKLEAKGDLILSRYISYYLIDQNHRGHRANRSGLLSIFPRQRRAIIAYLKENTVNFNQEEDLKRLLQFCSELSQQ